METRSLPPPIPAPPEPEAGARAIEVAAMLGDSVVEVKHLAGPRGGRVTVLSRAMLAGGAALLLLAALAFAAGVKTAAGNRRAFHRWVEIEQKPVSDFRPERLPLAYDWMAFGGGLAGLFLLAAGAVRVRRERVAPRFRIGRAAGVDAATDALAVDSFDLVAPRGDQFLLRVAPGMSAERAVAGVRQPVAEPEVVIAAGARYRVAIGEQSFLVSSVPAPRRQKVPLFATWERSVLAFAGGSLGVHLLLVALLGTIPPERRALDDDGLADEGRLTRIMTRPAEDAASESELGGDQVDASPGNQASAMPGEEGRFGARSARNPDGRYMMKQRAAEPSLARAEAVARARRAGILGELNPHVFASLTGTADFSSGFDDTDIIGGLVGVEAREAAGGWGFGVTGVGPGGGCERSPCGSIGVGGFGLIGHAGTGGPGFGTPGGGGPLGRRHRPAGPALRIGNASTTGELDPNTIRRYIRRRLPAIRHCYERQLVTRQDLAGTVVTQFQISPMGVVQGARAGGMGDPGVESCVAEAVRSIQFPRPKGGGFVNVRYPFIFQPAG